MRYIALLLLMASAVQAEEPIKLQSKIVGDKEQPAVSYFVPWQGPEGNERLYQNTEERYDNSLEAIDREVLLRSMRIYDEMNLENIPDNQ